MNIEWDEKFARMPQQNIQRLQGAVMLGEICYVLAMRLRANPLHVAAAAQATSDGLGIRVGYSERAQLRFDVERELGVAVSDADIHAACVVMMRNFKHLPD